MELKVNSDIFNVLSDFLLEPDVFNMVLALGVAIIMKLYLGTNENKSTGQLILETIIWIILFIIILSSLMKLLFGIEIIPRLKYLLSNNPVIEIDINTKEEEQPETQSNEEVFHVSGNKYTYKDAEPICKAYGARLANYNDIEKAYNNGGEWCEYGWSEGQMAFFPTQKDTWNNLQSSEKSKNACGRPGINGGYMENPNIRFGVNCYGVKPDITEKEKYLMDNTSYYNTHEEKAEKTRKGYWETHLSELILSPFNEYKWSRI